MNTHVWLEKRVTAVDAVLSQQDTQKKVKELLGSQFKHAGEVFRPDYLFFQLETNDGLADSAKQLFGWLGIKPGHLEIKYGSLPMAGIYTEDPGGKRMIINQRLASFPFQAAAVLTHLVMHVAIAGKRRFILEDFVENEQLTNQAIIQSGLALTVINGLEPAHWWHKLQRRKEIELSALFPDPEAFFIDFAQFIRDYRIHEEKYAHFLAPWIDGHLPEELKTQRTMRNAQPIYITATLKAHRKTMLKGLLLFMAVLTLVGAGIFAISRSSSGLTSEQQAQLQKISALKADYDTCITRLTELRKNLNHNDIFQQQLIDGEATRCTSLQNQYDNRVDTYYRNLQD
jgi:hypothetical protein